MNRIKNVLEDTKEIISFEISKEEHKLILTVKKEKAIDEAIKKIESIDF